MTPGSGKIDINGPNFENYFPSVPLQNVVLQPLQVAKMVNTYDLSINATGGGVAGQAGGRPLPIFPGFNSTRAQFCGRIKNARIRLRGSPVGKGEKTRPPRG